MLRSHIDTHVAFLTSKQMILSRLVSVENQRHFQAGGGEIRAGSIENLLLSTVRRPQPGTRKSAFPTQRGRGQTMHTEDLQARRRAKQQEIAELEACHFKKQRGQEQKLFSPLSSFHCLKLNVS